MRKTYLLLFMLCVSMVAMAGPITPDEARQKITKVMSPRRSAAVLQDLRLVATSHYQERDDVMAPSFYVFNVGEGQGYIIAGADDRIPVVLGYSDRGSFDPEKMPMNMQAWLKEYNAQMEYLNQHPEAAAPKKTVSGSSIDPLLGTTEWNQGNPYNSLCPMDGDSRSVTGCAATAMAQVMFFWKYPNYTVAEIPGYTTDTKGFNMPAIAAGTAIDWNNMLPKYNGSETEVQKQAVAELMLMCGTSLQMDYTSNSSGAVTRRAADAWKDYFDYDQGTKNEVREDYRLAAWNQKVYDELKAGRPVLYYGQSSGGGHAFVIDGYGGDDYFHVNWGWGGGSNDYFLLSILDSDNNSGIGASSSSDGYSFDQGAIFGAQPNTGVSPIVTPVLTTSTVRTDYTELSRTDVAENFQASVSSNCWNYTGATHTFELGYGVFDTEGQLLGGVVADWTANLEPSYGYSSLTFTVPFGANVSSGTYYLKPISREAGSETWYANLGTETNYLTATISDNTLTISAPKFGLTGSIDASGKKEVGVPLTLTATITNNGTLYNGQIFLMANGTSNENLIGGRCIDIDPGATVNVDFTFTPKTEGANDIYLCTRDYYSGSYSYTPFITGSVTIGAAAEASLTMTPKTKNAVKEDGKWIVKQSKAVISIDVTNTGSSDYDNAVLVKLYKLINESSGTSAGSVSKNLQLAAGASTTVELETDVLEDGATYFYYVYYMSAGEEVRGYQYSPMFTVKIEGEEPPQEVTKFTVQSIEVAGSLKTNEEVEMTISVKNEGTVDSGNLYVFINNVKQGDIAFTITPGETKDYKVKYLPTTAGEYTVKITTDEAGENLAGEESAATKTFMVKDPDVTKFTVQSIEVQGTLKTNEDVDITVNVKNEGNVQTGKLYYFINNLKEGEIEVDITPGETKAYALKYKPTAAKDYTIKVTTDEAGESLAGDESAAVKTFTVKDPDVTKFTVQSIEVQGTLKTNEDVDITVNVKNEGNVQTGKLYYFINNIKEGEIEVDITPGETKAYALKYKPTAAKDYTIKVTTDEAGESLAGEESTATKTFTVKDPDVTKFTVQSIEVQGTLKTNEDVDITVNVKNEGNVQTGKLYYFINNIKEGEIEVDITPGETKAYVVKYKPTAAKEYTFYVTIDEAGETLAGDESAAVKTFTISNPEKADPELAIQANEHYDVALGYFTAKLGKPYNSPQLSNPHNVSPIVWTSSDSSVATVDENGVVTLVSLGATQIRADFAGNDNYKAGYAEYYLEVSDIVNYNTNNDGTVTVTGGDVTGDVEIASTIVINGQAYQVTGIADDAFKDNTTITSVTIPDGITTIGANAFNGCSNMMTVIIGKDVATIGEKAFANIGTPANAPRRAEGEGMKVECHAESVPTTAANAFEGSPVSNGTLLVDDNSVMAYYAAEPWSLFGTIKGFNGTEPTTIKALWADGNGTAQIFSLDGHKHAEAQKSDLMRVLNTLPKGVYIIRVGKNSKTILNN